MKKLLFVMALFVLAGIIVGCGNEIAYEGNWITSTKSLFNSAIEVIKLEIKKNGENYIINNKIGRFVDTATIVGETGKKAAWRVTDINPVSATLQDGKLMVNQFFSYTYIQKDGTILGPKGEIYKKETPEEMKKLKQEAITVIKKENPNMIFEE